MTQSLSFSLFVFLPCPTHSTTCLKSCIHQTTCQARPIKFFVIIYTLTSKYFKWIKLTIKKQVFQSCLPVKVRQHDQWQVSVQYKACWKLYEMVNFPSFFTTLIVHTSSPTIATSNPSTSANFHLKLVYWIKLCSWILFSVYKYIVIMTLVMTKKARKAVDKNNFLSALFTSLWLDLIIHGLTISFLFRKLHDFY